MKFSQFNSIIFDADKYFIYNSFTEKCIFITSELKSILDTMKHVGIDSLKNLHPSFYSTLLANGFLVDDIEDEVKKVKKLTHTISNSGEKFELLINPTVNCNFKCWYCYENHNKSSKVDEVTFNKINKFIERCFTKNQDLKTFSLSFFGGEPLLYFEKTCYPIMQTVVNLGIKYNVTTYISFTTNAFLIDKKMVERFSEFKEHFTNIQITLDGYKEEHDKVRFVSDKRGSYDRIVENITRLVNNGFIVTLRINYTPDKLKNCHRILDDLKGIHEDKKRNLITSFNCVWQTDDGKNRSELLLEQMQKFNDKNICSNSNIGLHTIPSSCHADRRNSALINFNGDIYKCTARDFSSINREGYLNNNGEIIWENDSLERRMNSKFKNKPCLSCRVLPLCHGSCSQKHLENEGKPFCIYNFDENKIDDAIKFLIANSLQRRKLKNVSVKELEFVG